MRIILSFAAFLLFACYAHARNYEIERIGLERGLSNDYIMGITQDKQGFLWFSTESGLNRFDGRQFRVYKKNNLYSGNTISANELGPVYADKFDNVIWIATQRAGLNMFDCETETFTHYKTDYFNPHSISTNDITSVTNSIDGNLWITTYHVGFNYLDKKTKEFTRYNQATLPGLVSNQIWSMAEDKKGTLYIGHVGAGLSIYSRQTNSIKNYRHNPHDPHSLPGDGINVIFIDNYDNIWLGTDAGLALFDAVKEHFIVFKHQEHNDKSLVSNNILAITQLDDGKLCIGTENGGVSILDIQKSMFNSPKNIHFQNITPGDDEFSLSNQTVRAIYQDSFKNIWIGIYGGGINFISSKPSFFQTWSYSPIPNISNSLTHKTARSICVDEKERLWIGTDGGGIDLFENGKRMRVYNKENKDISDNLILSSLRDSKDNLWFGTFYGGVNLYNNKSKKIAPVYISGLSDVRCFSEDFYGNIWIGDSYGAHVYQPSKGKLKMYTQHNGELKDDLVRSIYHHPKDSSIWIGYFGQGLSIHTADMKLISSYTTYQGFPSNTVNHIYGDSAGKIWIATGEGLVLFEPEKSIEEFTIMKEAEGLADSNIKAIVEDWQHNIWLSTGSGISSYITVEKRFHNYSHYDGVPLGGFMSASVAQVSDGTIYFGSQNGVCYFNPINIFSEINLPPVYITDFKVYDDKIEWAENEKNIPIQPQIALDYEQNTFNVAFRILDYSLNHLVEYSYRLKGFDDSWYNSKDESSITFRNIPPGRYNLQIKSRIRNQEWSNDLTSLSIHIKPPFWLTWWAKGLYLLFIVSIIFFISRFYKRKLQLENSLILEKRNHLQEQELNNERLRFFTNITHELRTPLTLILGPLEDLNSDQTLAEKHSSKISVIYKSAARLLQLINQILEFRKTETQNKKLCVRKGDLANLVQETGLKYKELNIKKNLDFQIVIEEGDYQIFYDVDIITTILDNLLSNAFKYTDHGKISLILRQIENAGISYVEIEVKDTGRGIQVESLSKIFDRYYQEKDSSQSSGTGIGLALVKNLVDLHQGEIQVESTPGKGTSFYFRIHLSNTYPYALYADLEDTSDKEQESNSSHSDIHISQKQIILVIEDNEDINQYIVDSLSEYYQVYTAYNGKDGLEKAFQYIPDIIVSDVMMPEMDGFELTKKLKEDIRTSHIPIILLTAKDTI